MVDTKELAQGYTLVNDTQYNAGKFLLDRLSIVPGAQVLDVGCGTGNLTVLIADLIGRDGKVTGLDPSEERIAIANEKASPNLEFFVGRAEDLARVPLESIDTIFVNSTFHWVEDQLLALKECSRVLKSGGRVGISGGSGDYLTDQERIKEEVLSREPYRKYPEDSPPKFLKQSEMEALLDQAGFAKRDFVINPIFKTAKDGAAMVDWLDTSSSGKTYGGIPVELRPQAREEMKKEWAKLATDEGIRMKIELLVTVATKG